LKTKTFSSTFEKRSSLVNSAEVVGLAPAFLNEQCNKKIISKVPTYFVQTKLQGGRMTH
jgi:hypothetical protein